MDPQENIPLKQHSTLRVGGPARYFFTVHDVHELTSAISFAHAKNLPIFVLGGGSNTLFNDGGFFGVVVKIAFKGITFTDTEKGVLVQAQAGETWDKLVGETVKRNLAGLENLSLIPGSVGAGPIQNIGAYGKEVKDSIVSVLALDMRTGVERTFLAQECHFGYRDSFFKSAEGKNFVVLSVDFLLTPNGATHIEYKHLRERLDAQGVTAPTLQEVRDAVIYVRSHKLPDPAELGTAGSFFKNPVISMDEYEKLVKDNPDTVAYKMAENKVKIPASWLIDQVCGLKGYRVGDVGIHEKQAVTIVNYANATAEEIKKFALKIQKRVKEKTNIDLEFEVQVV